VEAFKPYGDVIQGFDLPTSAPKGIKVALANQGTAWKINRLAKVEETYPAGLLKRGGLGVGVIRQQSHYETKNGCEIPVSTLERYVHR
jgi:allantoicase